MAVLAIVIADRDLATVDPVLVVAVLQARVVEPVVLAEEAELAAGAALVVVAAVGRVGVELVGLPVAEGGVLSHAELHGAGCTHVEL